MCLFNCNFFILENSKSKNANNELDSAFNISISFKPSDLTECPMNAKDNNPLPTFFFSNVEYFIHSKNDT